MVSNICVFLVIVSIIATPILLLVSLIKWIRKKPVKKILLSALFSFCTIFVCSFIGALSMMPDSSNNANFEDDVISQQEDDRQNEEENICEHLWVETSREEPTEEEQGISYQKCEVCGETRRWFIPKIEHVVTFDEIYREYKSNELRADDKYKNKRLPIKTVLLDQSIIVGIGNIYADEILFLCKINPLKKCNLITEEEANNIIKYTRSVLEEAIKMGGTTIRTYSSVDGVHGLFQKELLVHGKDKGTCPECNTKIEKIRVGGRGTYYCPNCQK